MVNEKEIRELIFKAEDLGACVHRTRDEEIFREEGRDITAFITVYGVPGLRPFPLSPISATKRLREFVNVNSPMITQS